MQDSSASCERKVVRCSISGCGVASRRCLGPLRVVQLLSSLCGRWSLGLHRELCRYCSLGKEPLTNQSWRERNLQKRFHSPAAYPLPITAVWNLTSRWHHKDWRMLQEPGQERLSASVSATEINPQSVHEHRTGAQDLKEQSRRC